MADSTVEAVATVVFAPRAPEAGALPPVVVAAAADWLALLQSGMASTAQQQACAAWRAADTRHELAWERLVALDDALQQCPMERPHAVAARQALQALAQQQARRRMGRWLLGLGCTSVLAWQLRPHTTWPMLAASRRTATGERRQLVLNDGTVLHMASATAVDVQFTASERRIVLHGGEILVQSGHGVAGPDARPLRVATREGTATPVGTRFTVQRPANDWGWSDAMASRTRVAVLEGAVQLQPKAGGTPLRLGAGMQAALGVQAVDAPAALAPGAGAWADGMLVAERMRLGDFIAELARWRPGVLRCTPEAALLLISGAFPLNDTDRVLAMLVRILPVQLAWHTRWWVTVQAARS